MKRRPAQKSTDTKMRAVVEPQTVLAVLTFEGTGESEMEGGWGEFIVLAV